MPYYIFIYENVHVLLCHHISDRTNYKTRPHHKKSSSAAPRACSLLIQKPEIAQLIDVNTWQNLCKRDHLARENLTSAAVHNERLSSFDSIPLLLLPLPRSDGKQEAGEDIDRSLWCWAVYTEQHSTHRERGVQSLPSYQLIDNTVCGLLLYTFCYSIGLIYVWRHTLHLNLLIQSSLTRVTVTVDSWAQTSFYTEPLGPMSRLGEDQGSLFCERAIGI